MLTERRYRLSLTDLRMFLMARGRQQQSSDRRRGLLDRSELLTFRSLEVSTADLRAAFTAIGSIRLIVC
jgi:hypothetical protein